MSQSASLGTRGGGLLDGFFSVPGDLLGVPSGLVFVSQADLELMILPSPCFCLPSAGVAGMCHYAWYHNQIDSFVRKMEELEC